MGNVVDGTPKLLSHKYSLPPIDDTTKWQFKQKNVYVPTEIYDNDTSTTYTLDTFLSRGTYGALFRYLPPNNAKRTQGLALKVMTGTGDPEREELVHPYLKEQNMDCKIIKLDSVLTGLKEGKDMYYVMPVMDGSLFQLLKKRKLGVNEIKYIYNEVETQILCLYKAGLVYLDLKPANIMYVEDYDKPHQLAIYVGDLGSILDGSNLKPQTNSATHPPPSHCNNAANVPSDICNLNWVLGVFALVLKNPELQDMFTFQTPECKLNKGQSLVRTIDETYQQKDMNEKIKYLMIGSQVCPNKSIRKTRKTPYLKTPIKPNRLKTPIKPNRSKKQIKPKNKRLKTPIPQNKIFRM